MTKLLFLPISSSGNLPSLLVDNLIPVDAEVDAEVAMNRQSQITHISIKYTRWLNEHAQAEQFVGESGTGKTMTAERLLRMISDLISEIDPSMAVYKHLAKKEP